MARVNPKLNLNKTPQNVEDSSLVFAKNIKLNKELSICPDSAVKGIKHWVGEDDENPGLVGKIVGVNNKIYFFTHKEGVEPEPQLPDWRNSGGYIESNGTQYIDTDYKYKIGDEFDVIYIIKSDNENRWNTIFGARTANADHSLTYGYSHNNEPTYLQLGSNNITSFGYGYTRNIRYNIKIKDDGVYVDDVKVSSTVVNQDLNYNVCLFALNQAGTIQEYSFIKIYSVKIKRDNVLVREMYPAIVNNTPCMYDYVTNTYFYNQGTGDFTVSQEVIDASIPPEPEPGYEDSIYEYDELTEEVNRVSCSWKYNNGEITGCVTVNNTGEQILTIAEYNTETKVPIKHINLSKCSDNDDESIYTQHPNIPITNLLLSGYYTCNIPNGVYQFFVRYKIRGNFYTNWFPASKELFAGNINTLDTVQGKLKYTDINRDSYESFILQPQHLFEDYQSVYEGFQISFIISNDNGIFARSWKTFDFDSKFIYFDYYGIENINIDDLLKSTYEIFNPKNVINYKNKIYISNYEESNLDKELNIGNINIKAKSTDDFDSNYADTIDGVKLIKDHTTSPTNYTGDYYTHLAISSLDTSIGKRIYGSDRYCTIDATPLQQDPCSSGNGYTQRSLTTITKENVPAQTIDSYNINKTQILCIYTGIGTSSVAYKLVIDKDIRPTVSDFNPNPIAVIDSLDYSKIIKSILKWMSNPIMVLGIDDTTKSDFVLWAKSYDNTLAYQKVNTFYVYCCVNSVVNPRVVNFIPVVDIQKQFVLLKINCSLKPNIVVSKLILEYPHKYNTNTLLFHTKYDFYVHYVKQNGVATNGHYVDTRYLMSSNTSSTDPDSFDKNNLVYPVFSRINKPDGYAACFFSMKKANNVICELFNLDAKESSGIYTITADCLELDTSLYNLNNNLRIIDNTNALISIDGTYHPSGDTTYINNFGTAGFVTFSTTNYDANRKYYIVLETDNIDYSNDLIKVTPYIKLYDDIEVEYDNYLDLNLRGYICNVSKLKRIEVVDGVDIGADQYYISGTDVFTKSIDASSNGITLEDYNDIMYLKLNEPDFNIKSAFNLNFLSITEKVIPQIRHYTVSVTNNDSTTTEERNQIITSVNSLISSSIYTLYEMYKVYSYKHYSKIDDKKLHIFNNTVRSSNIDVDEVYRDIYRFEAEDYYNVPTNRGIIVNLFSIINKIYVHCEHALFVFTDTNMMKVGENLYTSNNTEIALQQSSPFEIGIQEIFDSEYGYAGLQNKKHSLITFNSYIFYDKLAKTIYAYSGDSVPTAISNGIDKILKWFEPDDIMFAADNTNDRFFINLRKEINDEIKNICLSFNFTSKSFVSIHDIDFDESFNSRINTYFQKNNQGENNDEVNIYKIDNDNINNYSFLKKISILQLADVDDVFANSINKVANSIDVICNIQYEVVKNLNWINWICREVNNYNVNPTITVAEEDGKLYSGHYIRIYSDETYSPLIPLTNGENKPLRSNDVPLMAGEREYNPQANTYPRYNCGVWSINNFRDIRNINTNKNPSKPDRLPISDNKSLLYGKYFVVRFIFKDKNFKLENIKFNMGNYEKS